MVDIKYTQNLYTNEENLKRTVQSIAFGDEDIVIDIGAGKGIITKELVKYCNEVLAYELDSKYLRVLEQQFKNNQSVDIRNEDFLTSILPDKEYKVFANIPFSLTSEIINKLTDTDSKLIEAYLFVQKESAGRYMGKPKNTQIAAILFSRYDLSVMKIFDRKDFKPTPNVDIVLLRIVKKDSFEEDFELYRDFITYIFNQTNKYVIATFKNLFTANQLRYIKKYLNENSYIKPSELSPDYYLKIFQHFKINGHGYKKRVLGYYEKYLEQHRKREKVNRTRI